jgi:hypothetical protein
MCAEGHSSTDGGSRAKAIREPMAARAREAIREPMAARARRAIREPMAARARRAFRPFARRPFSPWRLARGSHSGPSRGGHSAHGGWRAEAIQALRAEAIQRWRLARGGHSGHRRNSRYRALMGLVPARPSERRGPRGKGADARAPFARRIRAHSVRRPRTCHGLRALPAELPRATNGGAVVRCTTLPTLLQGSRGSPALRHRPRRGGGNVRPSAVERSRRPVHQADPARSSKLGPRGSRWPSTGRGDGAPESHRFGPAEHLGVRLGGGDRSHCPRSTAHVGRPGSRERSRLDVGHRDNAACVESMARMGLRCASTCSAQGRRNSDWLSCVAPSVASATSASTSELRRSVRSQRSRVGPCSQV